MVVGRGVVPRPRYLIYVAALLRLDLNQRPLGYEPFLNCPPEPASHKQLLMD